MALNAIAASTASATSRSSAAGWCAPTKALNKTEIVQHWWNVDAAARTCFDVSPARADCEYVLDMDLAEYGIRISGPGRQRLPAILSDGCHTMVRRIFGELFYKPIDNLRTAALFKKVI